MREKEREKGLWEVERVLQSRERETERGRERKEKERRNERGKYKTR